MKIGTLYGSTETGARTHAFKRTEEEEAFWDYMEFSKSTNIRWIAQGDGTYECQFLVSSKFAPDFNPLRGILRHAIHIFWQPKICLILVDMQHQTCLLGIQLRTTFGKCTIFSFSSAVKKSLFLFDSVGRIDDVVIHSSGEKTVPARIEDIVMSSK